MAKKIIKHMEKEEGGEACKTCEIVRNPMNHWPPKMFCDKHSAPFPKEKTAAEIPVKKKTANRIKDRYIIPDIQYACGCGMRGKCKQHQDPPEKKEVGG